MDQDERKALQRSYQATYYAKHKDRHIAAVRKREKGLQAWFQAYKRTLVCMSCGENHPACIEFHHVIGTDAKHEPGNLVRRAAWGKERIMEELNNCVPLCANCHRKVHADHREMTKKSPAK